MGFPVALLEPVTIQSDGAPEGAKNVKTCYSSTDHRTACRSRRIAGSLQLRTGGFQVYVQYRWIGRPGRAHSRFSFAEKGPKDGPGAVSLISRRKVIGPLHDRGSRSTLLKSVRRPAR